MDALFGEVEHLVELATGVGVFLGCGLSLDEAAIGQHDDVHVDGGAGVLFVGEVEEDVAVDDADGGGGDHLFQGRGFEGAGGYELVEREGQGDAGSGDGRGTGSAVGLEDVAVEDDGALAEGLHVYYAAEAAPDEALDLVGAAADLAALAFARGAGEGGAGEHAVLCGDPAAAGVAEPAGDALLDGGVTEDAGVARLHEDGAFGRGDVVGGDSGGAEGIGGAMVGAEEEGGCVRFGCEGNGHRGDYSCVALKSLVPKEEVTYGGSGSEMDFVPVMGILEELGFIWEKGRRGDDAGSILGIAEVGRLRDPFGFCFMSNNLGYEFQFGT